MKKIASILLIVFIAFLGGCANDSQSIKSENKQLKNKISLLQKDLNSEYSKATELESKEIKSLTINYIENTFSKRFIEKRCDLYALPTDNAMKLNSILENTVVTVIDTANVNSAIWFYASIPVYDSPANFKGWIREADTVLYTKDKVNKVQGDVKVKKGEDVYETDNFNDIKSVKPYKAESGEHGRIEEKKDGYIRIQCAGGKTIWIKESSAIYPEYEAQSYSDERFKFTVSFPKDWSSYARPTKNATRTENGDPIGGIEIYIDKDKHDRIYVYGSVGTVSFDQRGATRETIKTDQGIDCTILTTEYPHEDKDMVGMDVVIDKFHGVSVNCYKEVFEANKAKILDVVKSVKLEQFEDPH